MTTDQQTFWRKLLIVPPVVLGVALLLWIVGERQAPTQVPVSEIARSVRVIEAPLLALIPQAEGYGPVRPARVWTAVAQVAGRVVHIHPKLRDGEILSRDTLLIRIDPGDYEIALSEANAQLSEARCASAECRGFLGHRATQPESGQ